MFCYLDSLISKSFRFYHLIETKRGAPLFIFFIGSLFRLFLISQLYDLFIDTLAIVLILEGKESIYAFPVHFF